MQITFIGGGNMASAIIGGLLKQGFPAYDIQVVELLPPTREWIRQQYRVRIAEQYDAAILRADVVVLAVKPQQMRHALEPLAGRLEHELIVSIAAGVRLADLSKWLGGYRNLVRAMPNTPALIAAGVTGLYAHESVIEPLREMADQVMQAVGSTVWLRDEGLMDAVTAVSGSGPAYVFYMLEAMIEAGLSLGLDAASARKLAVDTFTGASRLASASEETPDVLRARVTSKGGTTEAAIDVLEQRQVKAALMQAIEAARSRGKELGDELGRIE